MGCGRWAYDGGNEGSPGVFGAGCIKLLQIFADQEGKKRFAGITHPNHTHGCLVEKPTIHHGASGYLRSIRGIW